MSNTRELRRRIKSVKNTAQITKAMQMVAATKMRRAQNQAFAGRPYNQTLIDSLKTLLPKINLSEDSHPLLQKNNSSSTGVLLLTTDKSLCGALNTNLFRQVQNFTSRHSGGSVTTDRISYYTIGKKGRQFVINTGKKLEADFENHEVITFRQATQTAKLLIKDYLSSKLGEVFIIYPDFVSTLRQEPRIVKLLPIDPSVIASELSERPGLDEKQKQIATPSARNDEVLIEPNSNELLDYVLLHFVENQIYQALIETKASEHSARMMAMQNATDNAKELVEDLNLVYNQTRQGAITTELLEITSAQLALE